MIIDILANLTDDTTEESIEDFKSTNEDDPSCNTYNETICTRRKDEGDYSQSHKEDCHQLPIRLCAEGCKIKEGPTTCKDIQLVHNREIPTEECKLLPQKICR